MRHNCVVIFLTAVSIVAGGCSSDKPPVEKGRSGLSGMKVSSHFMFDDTRGLAQQPTLFDSVSFGGFVTVPQPAGLTSINVSGSLQTTDPLKIEQGIRVRAESGLARYIENVQQRERTTVALEKQIARARIDPVLQRRLSDLYQEQFNEELQIRLRFASEKLDLLVKQAAVQSRPRVLGLPVEEDPDYKAVQQQLAQLEQREEQAIAEWRANSDAQVDSVVQEHEQALGRTYAAISAESRRRIDELVERRSQQVRRTVDSFLENFFATLQKPEVSSSAKVELSPDATLRTTAAASAFAASEDRLETRMNSNIRLAERIVEKNSIGRSTWTALAAQRRAELLVQGQP